jgi:DNA primase
MSQPALVSQVARAKGVLTIPKLWAIFHLPGRPATVCFCPFTTDRRSGFSVSDDGLRWIDFVTAERGDAIDFLAKIRGVSRPEAHVEFLKLHEAIIAREEAQKNDQS